MTASSADRDQATRDRLAAVMPEHQSWCHAEAHGECCGANDCDCGVDESLAYLIVVVADLVREGQAEALEAAAESLRGHAVESNGWTITVRSHLRDRAAALRAPRAEREADRG